MAAVFARILASGAALPPDWGGAEFWSQVYEDPGRGLAFHFDKDEHMLKDEGRMVNPIFSSVLYVNSPAETGEESRTCSSANQETEDRSARDPPTSVAPRRARHPPLGATLVMDQRWDEATSTVVPEPSRRDVLGVCPWQPLAFESWSFVESHQNRVSSCSWLVG